MEAVAPHERPVQAGEFAADGADGVAQRRVDGERRGSARVHRAGTDEQPERLIRTVPAPILQLDIPANEADVPVVGLPGFLLLGMLLGALGIHQTRRRAPKGDQS